MTESRNERHNDGFVHINLMLEQGCGENSAPNSLNDPWRITELLSDDAEHDGKTPYFQPGELTLLAGCSSMEITALVLNSIDCIALNMGQPVGVFSMGNGGQLTMRLLASISRINVQRIENSNLDENEWQRLSVAREKLQEAPIYIDETMDLAMLNASAQNLSRHWGGKLGLLIIDHMELIRVNGRDAELFEITNILQSIAHDLLIPVVALSETLVEEN